MQSLTTRIVTIAAIGAVGLISNIAAAPIASASTVWDRVAACESGGNWSISTGNGFYGGLQFTHSTWVGYGGGAYAYNANGASKAAQIAIATRVLAGQGPGAWPVCSVRAGLSRGNGATVSRTETRVVTTNQLAVDGIIGPLTRAQMRRHGIYLNTRPAILAWQARLRVARDGIVGPVTSRALQRWLNTH